MKSLLIILLACTCVVAEDSPTTAIASIKDADGRDAFKLSNGKLEAIVVPALGRVMHFSQAGGTNWLWNAHAERVVMSGWKNYGGEKAWVSPQASWPLFFGRNFPPDEAWESGHQGEVLDHPPRLRTTSTVSVCGIQIVREFAFNNGGEFVTTTTLEKRDGAPLIAGAWTVAQVAPPDAIFLPTSETSAYKNNFYTLSGKVPEKRFRLMPSLLRLTPSETGSFKIGVDSPVMAIAAVSNGVAFVLRANKENAKYPDGPEQAGFPVELFDLGVKEFHYVELELLSPISILSTGQRRTFVVRWSLHELPSRDIDSAETRTAIEKLIHEK